MKVFTRNYRITGDYPEPFASYFKGMKPCVLDIETTGLRRETSRIVLIGLLTKTESGARVTQFLAENHYEEVEVLDATLDFIKREAIDYLVTYNGAAFDIPFLNSRIERTFTGDPLRMYNFDLYGFLRKGTDLKAGIGSLSQKSLENHYGILEDRGDTITGRESITMFDEYALSGNSTLEKIILTHNREDVLHLHRLMYAALADVPDMHQALAAYGLPAARGRLSARPKIINKNSRCRSAVKTGIDKRTNETTDAVLRITGEQIVEPVSRAFFTDIDSPVEAVFNSASRSFEIKAPVRQRGEDLYMDVSFLISKDQKSNAHYSETLLSELISSPDYVNGYLILSPQSINLLSILISESYL